MNKCKRCFHEDKYHDERGCHHYYKGDKTVCLCLKYNPIGKFDETRKEMK